MLRLHDVITDIMTHLDQLSVWIL